MLQKIKAIILHNALTKKFLRANRNIQMLIIALVFGIIGTTTLLASKAASTAPLSFEAEAGTLSGGATIGNDSNASGGKYVQMGSGTTTPPPSLPPSTSFQPTAPYHATFYYPWYKNKATDGSYSYWQDNGNTPPNSWFSHFLPDINPSAFDPSTELYSSNDYNTFKWQVSKMAEAKQEVAIASWFGQGTKQDTAIKTYLGDFMKRTDNPYPNLRWALYYECEGIPTSGSPSCPSSTATPTTDQIVNDLTYIKANMANSPYFLKVNGKPVIFVYGETENTNTLTRWANANAAVGNYFYVVQKVFSGFATATPQPDSWHQYGPASNYGIHGSYSAYVSPGFWKDVSDPVDGAVRLSRDLTRFQTDVSKLASASVTWRLVETWNEWGEGSSVEPGTQTMLDSTGKEVADPNGAPFGNAYIQALADRLPALEQGTGKVASAGNSRSTVASIAHNVAGFISRTFHSFGRLLGRIGSSIAGVFAPQKAYAQTAPSSFVFSSGGDIGANSTTSLTFGGVDKSNSKFFLALGDIDYDETASDAAWCDYVKGKLPTLFGANPTYPVQIITGNHEEQGGPDGYIMNHAACMPDRMASTGDYAKQYYFDYPSSAPLMRVIMISANLTVDNVKYDYTKGSTYYNWLSGAIDSARAAGIPWITVGMHKTCLSAGVKPCEIGTDLVNLLASKKVDIVLQGHEHNYQRTQQLAINGTTCTGLSDTTYNSSCIVPRTDSNTYVKGAGPLFLINGNFGRSGTSYPISTTDPSYPYMVKANADGANRGFMQWTVTASRIDAKYVPSAGTLTDSFAITSGTTSPAGDTTPPTVSLSAPSSSATVSGTIAISASATDNIGVSKVDFFIDGKLLGSSTTAPYTVSWDTTKYTNGSHTVQAKAYDAAGNTSSSSTITTSVSNGCTALPSALYGQVSTNISIPGGTYSVWVRMIAADTTNNSLGVTVGGQCPILMGDNAAISASQWTWVNYKIGDTSSIASVTIPAGTQSIIISGTEPGVKFDRVLLLGDTCVPTGTGDNCTTTPDTTPPTISLASPASGATVSGSVSIQASASDANGIGRVEFFVDNLLVNSDTSSPYAYDYMVNQLKPGSHIIKAVAYDIAGNFASAQNSVTVQDVTAPAVTLKQPASGSTVSGTVSISISASDLGTLAKADFLIDGLLLNSVNGAGPDYIASWDTSQNTNGTHTIAVDVYDTAGNKGSSSVPVTIKNDVAAPTAPTNVTAQAANSQQVNIAWGAATDDVGVAGYYVLRNNVVVAQVAANSVSLSYSDAGLTAATTYSYTVAAFDAAGHTGPASAPTSVTTPAIADTTAPTVPANFSATAASSSQVNLSWSASTDTGGSGLAGYRVLRDGQTLASITSTSFSDATVSAGNTYRYSVAAYDGANNISKATTEISVTTPSTTSFTTLANILPTADSYIRANSPGSNYGSSRSLYVDNNSAKSSLFKFNVSSINGRIVAAAKLRIYATNSTKGPVTFWRTSFNTWSESTVTWNNAPQPTAWLANLSPIRSGNWYDIDITPYINSDGIYSIRLNTANSDGTILSSREATNKPKLIITVQNP